MPQPAPHGVIIKKGTDQYVTLKERVWKAIAEAREALATADEAIATTRARLQRTNDTLQHIKARREREAEQPVRTYQLPRSSR